jgi:hypothetical protein
MVAIWNGWRAKGRELWFHLRIDAAIAPAIWLSFICPACQRIGEIDRANSIAVPTRRLNLQLCCPRPRAALDARLY